MKGDLPPLALPKKEYMERAKKIWEELGLPALTPQPPWHGYSLGDWHAAVGRKAKRRGRGPLHLENGRATKRGAARG